MRRRNLARLRTSDIIWPSDVRFCNIRIAYHQRCEDRKWMMTWLLETFLPPSKQWIASGLGNRKRGVCRVAEAQKEILQGVNMSLVSVSMLRWPKSEGNSSKR